jgi:hypothetical protein
LKKWGALRPISFLVFDLVYTSFEVAKLQNLALRNEDAEKAKD